MLGGQPAAVARYFGTAVFSVVNIIFLVSSCTVLDSTFASTSKLFGPELFGAILRGKPLPPQMATQKLVSVLRYDIKLGARIEVKCRGKPAQQAPAPSGGRTKVGVGL
jgi:hypothetical protein